MIALLFWLPVLAGLLAFMIRSDRLRRGLLVGTALGHALLVGGVWIHRPHPIWSGWLALDDVGLLFLTITSVVFLAAAVYAVGYLAAEHHPDPRRDFKEGVLFSNGPESFFTGGLLLFLATMTVMVMSQNFGIFWVALEASTLASAPLIYFHRHHRSLEASWKYLVLCSVGIAVALLGNFCLALAASAHGNGVSLEVVPLLAHAAMLDPRWLKAAFLFMLVGYGTKMGLAPLHTWLPDAHAESPSLVSALLSGALLNCAFLGILRIYQVCAAAGLGSFSQGLLTGFGLLSMAVATIYILNQSDYKRMLAYSSVEHMGLLTLGVGLGGAGVFGALLHAVNHSLAKAMLFLVAGNILSLYQTRTSALVKGVLRRAPSVGILWMVGLFAITGFPPFGTFLSEFTILKRAFDLKDFAIGTAVLVFLGLVFVGFATSILAMAQGPTDSDELSGEDAPVLAATPTAILGSPSIGWLNVMPPAVLGAVLLALGLYLPAGLDHLLHAAAVSLGGS